MVMLAKVLPVELGIPWYTQLLDKSDGNQDLILPKDSPWPRFKVYCIITKECIEIFNKSVDLQNIWIWPKKALILVCSSHIKNLEQNHRYPQRNPTSIFSGVGKCPNSLDHPTIWDISNIYFFKWCEAYPKIVHFPSGNLLHSHGNPDKNQCKSSLLSLT